MQLRKNLLIKVNKEAKEYIEFASEQCRLIYNFTLAEQIEYYKQHKEGLSIFEQKKQLPNLKEKHPNYAKVYNKCLTQMYFRLKEAFTRFFKKQSKFPKFKKKNTFCSQEYPSEYIKVIDEYRFVIPTGKGCKNFIARTYEPIPKEFSSLTITKVKDNYIVSFVIEVQEEQLKEENNLLVFDLGKKTWGIGVSTKKNFVEVPKFKHSYKHLDELQSKRDKKIKGSNRWNKLNKTYIKRCKQRKNRVNDYLHKSTTWIAKDLDETTIIVGDLNLKTMKVEEPWFNRSTFNEWRIGRFVELLNYKCKLYGKKFFTINERYTTQECLFCENRQKLELSERVYDCLRCGFKMDRDEKSAIKILERYSTAGAAKVVKALVRFGDAYVLPNDRLVFNYN